MKQKLDETIIFRILSTLYFPVTEFFSTCVNNKIKCHMLYNYSFEAESSFISLTQSV